MHGEFRGFFRDFLGKRRLVLRVGEEEHYLKVPRELREQLGARIKPGDAIVVGGLEEPGPRGNRLVVSRVRRAGEADLCAVCPIVVCAKKNCWRGGGRELWSALERGLAEAGLAEVVKLKAVDCLDRCKHAPNADWQGHEYRRCGPREAAEIVARITVEVRATETR